MPRTRTRVVDPKAGLGRRARKLSEKDHVVNESTKGLVRYLIILGRSQKDIARAARISEPTLCKYYAHELATAYDQTGAMLMQTEVMRALGGPGNAPDKWKQADQRALEFLLSRVYGLTSTDKHIHAGMIGTFDYSKLTDAEIATLEPILRRLESSAASNDAERSFGGENEEGD